jgi:deoxyribodipyrimidine photolyase-related protein
MSKVTIIFPHQLYKTNSTFLDRSRAVYLVEEPLLLTDFPTHKQKLLLHRLSLKTYEKELRSQGYDVYYFDVREFVTTEAWLDHLKTTGVTELHIADTTDNWLEKRLGVICSRLELSLIRYESEIFILRQGYKEKYLKSGKHMARFYKQLRQETGILMDDDNEPVGGQYSFDEDNRQKLPKSVPLPEDISFIHNEDVEEALQWLEQIKSEQYGEAKVWLPYDRAGAQAYLEEFIQNRLAGFGPYEDAITTRHKRLFHSTLSPLINIGLIEPMEVIEAALKYSKRHEVPLNSLEGFIRQILGWREFIRAAYEVDGTNMRNQNFFNQARTLPPTFWTGETVILPIDLTIKKALELGYNHHIERLMVLGSFMMLSEIHPNEVYRWFMAMYVDAYDWVMVPNVYGMSQFADGGSFATKPYISGANYLRKMSDLPGGNWEDTWTGLYWYFISKHVGFFNQNHRLSMMPKLLIKMSEDTRLNHLKNAKIWLDRMPTK